MDTQEPKNESTQRPLRDCHDDIALDRGADNDGEFIKKGTLLVCVQWNGVLDTLQQLVTVAQQEEEQIQHQEHADDEVNRVLTYVDDLCSEKLAPRCQAKRQLL